MPTPRRSVQREEGTMMTPLRTYPHGVPSWIDTERIDPHGTAAFYGELLGWSFREDGSDGPPELVATLAGEDGTSIGSDAGHGADWNTYIAVDDADAAAARIAEAGGTLVAASAGA